MDNGINGISRETFKSMANDFAKKMIRRIKNGL